MALLLNRSDVQKLLPMSQAIDVVEAAFGELEAGTAEMPAIASGVAAFLTGELLVLAFGMMLFAFALLTWPSDDRVAYWLALGQRG